MQKKLFYKLFYVVYYGRELLQGMIDKQYMKMWEYYKD